MNTKINYNNIDKIMHSDKYLKFVKNKLNHLRNITIPWLEDREINEASVRSYFDNIIASIFSNFLVKYNLHYSPIQERKVPGKSRYSVVQGRADTSVGTLVIEYKQPSTFSSHKMKLDALKQGIDYLKNLNKIGNKKDLVFATDGISGGFYKNGESKSEFINTDFHQISVNDMQLLINSIINTSSSMLSSKNLIEDFVLGNDPKAIKLARDLNTIIQKNPSNKTNMLYTEWKRLFDLSHDDESQQNDIKKMHEALGKVMNINLSKVNPNVVYKTLFSLQTSYAILIKMIAFKVISHERYNDNLMQFSDFITDSSKELLFVMHRLESGYIMRSYGIYNLLEGSFFSWYAEKNQWNNSLYDDVYRIATILSKYRSTIDAFKIDSIQDFFKGLYQRMIPRAVRHTLGEYYTPYWLAKSVEHQLLLSHPSKNPYYRVLDPTCGSGTFLTVMIKHLMLQGKYNKLNKGTLLSEITHRVVGIDINPLAALTARINYFLNISPLLKVEGQIRIPVYTGDSAYTPKIIKNNNVKLITYELYTKLGNYPFKVPAIALNNTKAFSKVMSLIEDDIQAKDTISVFKRLMTLIPTNDKNNKTIINSFKHLANMLVNFAKRNWDGIWARIIANYLSVANIGKFDYIVGNLPWVDWRNLPSKYRDKIKSLSISKRIFSGDHRTGGINLNIAALILFVSINNWLKSSGAVGVLMPNTFILQKTYEGFRKLEFKPHHRAYFYALDDWSKAGKPFDPVQQKFNTYYISESPINYKKGIPVRKIILKHHKKSNIENLDFKKSFKIIHELAVQTNAKHTNLILTNSRNLMIYQLIGKQSSIYRGRQGVELYPKELMHFHFVRSRSKRLANLTHVYNQKAKFKIRCGAVNLEKSLLHPLIESPDIHPFHVNYSGIVVPFAYNSKYSKRYALPSRYLRLHDIHTYRYFMAHKNIFLSQTAYTRKRMVGTYKKAPFYSSARIGDYTFAPYTVAFRDNSKQDAAVVSNINTPWGTNKKPVFLKHAATITQRPNRSFISKQEAYYIVGIFNSDIVKRFVKDSSDSRSHPIAHVRFQIPLFNDNNDIQIKISHLSQLATKHYNNNKYMQNITKEISQLYLQLLTM